MATFLYVSIGLCFLTHIVFSSKADKYKRKSEEAAEPWAKDLFDKQRISWERFQSGAVAIAIYAFIVLVLFT